VPLTTLVLFTLVIVGATGSGVTVSVKLWVAVPTELLTVMVNVYVPAGVGTAIVTSPVSELILTPYGAPVKE